jgi:hypothetical protein
MGLVLKCEELMKNDTNEDRYNYDPFTDSNAQYAKETALFCGGPFEHN